MLARLPFSNRSRRWSRGAGARDAAVRALRGLVSARAEWRCSQPVGRVRRVQGMCRCGARRPEQSESGVRAWAGRGRARGSDPPSVWYSWGPVAAVG